MKKIITNKKALSPIIAVILILMITIAGAAAAFFWFIRMQSELQGSTETYSEDLSEKISSRVEVVNSDAYTTNVTASTWLGNATLYLQNQGTNDLDLTDEKIVGILTKSGDTICSGRLNGTIIHCISGCSGTLSSRDIKAINLNFSVDDCNVAEGKYKLALDFNGETATAKEFVVESV